LKHQYRVLSVLASVLAFAACSPDSPNPVAPAASAARNVATGGGVYGRYILASSTGFSSDLAVKIAALGGKVERLHSAAGFAVVTNISDANAGQLASLKGVDDVEPDLQITLSQPIAPLRSTLPSSVNAAANSQMNPAAAARYSFQWNMRLIDADKAWAAGKLGSSGVTVAIMDTGIDYDAPDLDGLVDLSRSISFIPSDDSITATYFPSRNVISDYNGHGTNVATQVSSKAVALAGVTSKTTLIAVKVLNGLGSGPLSTILTGVLYAADHGANVANMSLGATFARPGNHRYINLIKRIFNYANRKNMLIVVAAGNDAVDLDHNGNVFDAYCDAPHVICVSAVGPAVAGDDPNTPAYYTDFGRRSIDVAAPGGNADEADGLPVSNWPWGPDIASWVWSFCSKTTIVFDSTGTPLGLAGCQDGNLLTGFIGTSQAAPHVAGLAALLMAERGTGNPARIKGIIERSAIDFGRSERSPYYGNGRISVSNALKL
jgi:subtilisin family serine protease